MGLSTAFPAAVMDFSAGNNTISTLFSPTNNTTPQVLQSQQIFFQTAAARGISGFFVMLALLISCHQVRVFCLVLLRRYRIRNEVAVFRYARRT
jgi:hypothetical protein